MNLLCTIYRTADQIRTALVGGHLFAILTTPEGVVLTTPEGVILTTPPVEYRGDIIEDVEVSRSLPDLFYGVQQTDPITIRLANADNGVDPTWDEIAAEEELRGLRMVLSRDNFTFVAAGKITDYTLGLEASITMEPRDDEVFEALIPAGVVTTDLFTATAMDIGKPIPINLGYCKNVPCPNIQNNTDDDYYDYLIGYGTVESLWIDHAAGRGVKREGVLVTESEYTFYDGSQGSPFAGYAFIRFVKIQKGFSGQYLKITADVKGLELDESTADRSFVNQIEAIISNATWGLSESVNAVSFVTAAAALPTTLWKCDISLNEQCKARDYLDDLLFACHSWIEKNSAGEWEITVDGTGSSVLSLGENDGYYNNCDCLACGVTPSSNAIKTAYVRYDNGEKQISLAVHTTFGIDRTYELPCVIDDDTAKKILSYIYGRATYADKKLQLSCTSEASTVLPGDIITVTIPARNISAVTYRVTGTSRSLSEYILDCEVYDSAIFDDQVISAPTAQTVSETVTSLLSFYTGNGSTNFLEYDGIDTKGNFSEVVNMAAQGGCKVHQTSAQSIPNGTGTLIDFQAEAWDTQNEFNLTTDKFTLSGDSKIAVVAFIESASLARKAGDSWTVILHKNGDVLCFTKMDLIWADTTTRMSGLLLTLDDADANDYFEIFVYQWNTVSGARNTGGEAARDWVSFQKLA